MPEINGVLALDFKRNMTSFLGEQQNSVYTDSGAHEKGNTASICVGVIIGLSVLLLGVLLLYRQLNKRKKQSGIHQEKARRESVRQAVRLRLQELEHVHDSTPWLEQTKVRASSVTFGDVVLINPSDSPVSSPVLDHRKHYVKYDQAYHHPYHHSIYNPSKRRFHHTSHYPKMSHSQQHHVQSSQRRLHVAEDHTRDNKIRLYPNSDHHRLSVHKKFEPATEQIREASMKYTNIIMGNNEHHRLSAHNKQEPAQELAQELAPGDSLKSTNIMMPNNGHHRLSAHKQLGPATQLRKASINSRNILMPNNDHHRLSLQKQAQPSEHVGQETIKSTNSSHFYRRYTSNNSLNIGSDLPQRSASFNRKTVVHSGRSARKTRSATVPVGVDAAY